MNVGLGRCVCLASAESLNTENAHMVSLVIIRTKKLPPTDIVL